MYMTHKLPSRCLIAVLISAFFAVMINAPAVFTSAHAVTAEEQLADPVLEDRARALFLQLRCLVCQNQSIGDSDAELAVDLRKDVRKMLLAGTDEPDILTDIHQRYGDYVLMRPPVTTQTALLWGLPALLVIAAFGIIWLVMRRRAPVATMQDDASLSMGTPKEIKLSALSPRLLASLAVLIILGAGSLYLYLGNPGLPSAPIASRMAEIAQADAMSRSLQQQADTALSAARTARDVAPEDIETLLRLALAAAAAEAHDEEILTLQTALRLSGSNPAIKSLLADARYRQAGRLVTPPLRILIDEILTERPDDVRALFLYGLAAHQDEDYPLALARFIRLLALTPQNAPWAETLNAQIIETASQGGLPLPAGMAGPSAADITAAAALSDDERSEMINSMVAQLETRLIDQPDDLAGWLRLAQVKSQLGRSEDAFYAYVRAAQITPRPDIILQALELMLSLGNETERPDTAILDAALLLISQLSDNSDYQAEALFFGGHVASLTGDKAAAVSQWQALLELLPDDSDAALSLAREIEKLRGN